jgi:hypothetical protein
MKTIWKLSAGLLLYLLIATIVSGKSTSNTTGETASGTGGSVTYSVGQTAYSDQTGTNGFIIQGVQQPYKISVLTAIDNKDDISLACSVYPNPTGGNIKLIIKSLGDEDFWFRLYNLHGTIMMEGKVAGEETEISMDDLSSATYFLRVLKDDCEVKLFRVVKR